MLWFIYCWCVQWALNGLEKAESGKQIMFCLSALQWGTQVFGLIGRESLGCSRNDLDLTQRHGEDPHEGQFTQSGWEHGETRYWKTTSLLVG